jgi:molybdenum cofactor synthesis domain-containing protein
MRALVIVASNRAWAGVYADSSGPILVSGLRQLGFEVGDPVVVPDGDPVADELRKAIDGGVDLAVTSGGTGITPTDRTPDVTRALLDYEVPGIAEAIRGYSRDRVPTSVLSRGLAGVAGRTLVVNVPGSTGGARDAIAVLGPIVVHAIEQIHGSDHR